LLASDDFYPVLQLQHFLRSRAEFLYMCEGSGSRRLHAVRRALPGIDLSGCASAGEMNSRPADPVAPRECTTMLRVQAAAQHSIFVAPTPGRAQASSRPAPQGESPRF
jgi:hypothetical protein